MAYETVLLEKRGSIAKITLNRPQALNAINDRMFVDLNLAIDECTGDSDVRVVVLTGAGKAFCASADVKQTPQGGDRFMSQRTANQIAEYIQRYPQRITRQLYQMEKPTIAMVNGLAIGTGFDWVLACDIRVGCENSRFKNAFLQMALIPGSGGTWLYYQAFGRNKALELLYTGDWLDAQEAYRLGALNRLVPAAELEEQTMRLAQRIADQPPLANRLVKKMAQRSTGQTLDEHLTEAAWAEVLTMTSHDHEEALSAFSQKRAPKFRGE